MLMVPSGAGVPGWQPRRPPQFGGGVHGGGLGFVASLSGVVACLFSVREVREKTETKLFPERRCLPHIAEARTAPPVLPRSVFCNQSFTDSSLSAG